MAEDTPRRVYLRGFLDALPFVPVLAPFGILFGVVATEAGLDLLPAMTMSVLVVAGAAQFTALQLLSDNAGPFAALAASLAVNLRTAMYSASLVPHLGQAKLWQRALLSYAIFDQNYALTLAKYEAEPDMPLSHRLAYFFGATTPIVPLWYTFTLIGVLAGNQIPAGLPLDFALPITFLALIAPMLRTLAHVAAAFVSIIVALALSGLPSGIGLIIAGMAAMVTGAAVETWREARR